MNIGLLMGSFDPIHIGHLHMASLVLNAKLCDNVWFVVAKHNPWKGMPSASFQDRCAMVELATQDSNLPLYICGIEGKIDEEKVYAYRTLELLTHTYPEHKFTIIGGTDVINTLPQWAHYHDAIKGKYGFIEITRNGEATQAVHIVNINNLDLGLYKSIEAPQLDISSTCIRNIIKGGFNPYPLVPFKVQEYIIHNQLYI